MCECESINVRLITRPPCQTSEIEVGKLLARPVDSTPNDKVELFCGNANNDNNIQYVIFLLKKCDGEVAAPRHRRQYYTNCMTAKTDLT